jgi:hypothetical protein
LKLSARWARTGGAVPFKMGLRRSPGAFERENWQMLLSGN